MWEKESDGGNKKVVHHSISQLFMKKHTNSWFPTWFAKLRKSGVFIFPNGMLLKLWISPQAVDTSPSGRFLKFETEVGRGSFKTVFKGKYCAVIDVGAIALLYRASGLVRHGVLFKAKEVWPCNCKKSWTRNFTFVLLSVRVGYGNWRRRGLVRTAGQETVQKWTIAV